jgi:hypothetical protein
MGISIWLEEYAKHSALNLGQVLQGLRYFHSHPDFDSEAGMRRVGLSSGLRAKRIANDFFYAALPPQLHHTREELAAMRKLPFREWLLCGYAPYLFLETGQRNPNLTGKEDPRWDPRCRRPSP